MAQVVGREGRVTGAVASGGREAEVWVAAVG